MQPYKFLQNWITFILWNIFQFRTETLMNQTKLFFSENKQYIYEKDLIYSKSLTIDRRAPQQELL